MGKTEDIHFANEEFIRRAGAKVAVLSREQEAALAVRIKGGDVLAEEALIRHNLRYICECAKRYAYSGVPMEDLLSAGAHGMVIAARRFDAARGYKFISYAHFWVNQKMLCLLADESRPVRVPINRANTINAVSKASRRFLNDHQREPVPDEIAKILRIRPPEVAEAMALARSATYLDATASNQDGDDMDADDRAIMSVVRGSLPNLGEDSPDWALEQESHANRIASFLECLAPTEYTVLCHKYGLNGHDELTLEEIGAIIGRTRERVRQIRNKALEKLTKRHGPEMSEMVGGAKPVPRLGYKLGWYGMEEGDGECQTV